MTDTSTLDDTPIHVRHFRQSLSTQSHSEPTVRIETVSDGDTENHWRPELKESLLYPYY